MYPSQTVLIICINPSLCLQLNERVYNWMNSIWNEIIIIATSAVFIDINSYRRPNPPCRVKPIFKCLLKSSYFTCFVGRVKVMAHVEPVGNMRSWLKYMLADWYPKGGILSAPVKNIRTSASVTCFWILSKPVNNKK